MLRALPGLVTVAVSAAGCDAARAFPDGAPWGAADPGAEENCISCHFDGETVRDSGALRVEGLPDRLSPGGEYELVVTFDNPGSAAGFQMLARFPNRSAGTFEARSGGSEALGSAIRSTAPVKGGGTASWALLWRVPATLDRPVVVHVAASAANDDDSPLGDSIHFRSYRYPAN